MAVRYSAEGGMSDPASKDTGPTPGQNAGIPSAPPDSGVSIRIGGQVGRATSDGKGNVTVQNVGPTAHQAAPDPNEGQLTGRTSYGAPLDPSAWTPETIVYHPSIGDGRIQDLMAAGLLVKTATGYQLAHANGTPVETTTPPTEGQQQQQQEEAPKDLKLTPTSAESDAFVSRMTEATSAQFVDSVVGQLADSGELSTQLLEQAASRSGLEPSAVAEGIQHRISEGTRAAKEAAAHAGVPSEHWDSFVAELWSRNPDRAREVVQDVASMSVASLMEEARGWVSRGGVARAALAGISDADVYGATFGEGIEVSRGDHAPVLTIKGERMSLAEAVQRGLVKLSRG